MLFYLDDKEFGRFFINTRRGMTRVSFHWKDGQLYMALPPGVPKDEVLRLLDKNREPLRQLRDKAAGAQVRYHAGQRIECLGCAVTLGEQSHNENVVVFGVNPDNKNEFYVNVPAGTDFDSPEARKNIARILLKLMHYEAEERLLPFAQQVAQEVGAHPLRFEVGRGLRKLGHCTQQGVIQLSRALMFLPQPLARHIICHELAHLTHMNHSAAFHALVNRYDGGKEKELEHAVRTFPFPVPR